MSAKIALAGNFTLTPTTAGDTTWNISAGSRDVDYAAILRLGASQAFDIGAGRTLTFVTNGYLHDGGLFAQRLTKTGEGTLVFTFFENRIAGFDVAGGTVKVSRREHFGCPHDGSPNPTWDAATTTLSNGGAVVATATMDLTIAPKSFILGAGGGRLGADTGVVLQIGNINNQISGAGAFGIRGPGTVALTRPNNFTGATTIESGTLRLTHASAVAASPRVTVAAGTLLDVSATSFGVLARQILAGVGTVRGSVSVAGGLEPGPGLTFEGNLQLAGTASTTVAVAGWGSGQHGQARGDGSFRSVTFGGTLIVNFTSGVTPGSARIFDFNTYGGAFSAVQTIPAGVPASFDPATGVLTVVPAGTLILVR